MRLLRRGGKRSFAANRHCRIALQRQHQGKQQGKPNAKSLAKPHGAKTYHRTANNTRELRTS
jgi:hypothetical protein